MTCPGFPQDVYAFHALGLLDAAESEALAGHLERQCETCLQSTRDARAFWAVLAASESPADPPRALRTRILAMVEPPRTRRFAWSPLPWAAAAAGIAIVALTAWNLGKTAATRDLAAFEARIGSQRAAIERLEAANRAAAIVPAPAPAPAPSPSVTPPAAFRELESKLRAAESLAAAAARDLELERGKFAAAEKELAERSAALTAAALSRDETERKLRDAAGAAAAETARAATQRAAEAGELRARIRELEGQTAALQRTVQQQQQRLEAQLRLASLLRSPSATLVRLTGTQAGPGASGTALIANNSVLFFASNLPRLANRRVYQLWLIRRTGPAVVSAGTFSAWSQDSPAVQFNHPALTGGITAVAVTEEPAGGSALPTGDKLLIGAPRG